jgi:hypothetical protein
VNLHDTWRYQIGQRLSGVYGHAFEFEALVHEEREGLSDARIPTHRFTLVSWRGKRLGFHAIECQRSNPSIRGEAPMVVEPSFSNVVAVKSIVIKRAVYNRARPSWQSSDLLAVAVDSV